MSGARARTVLAALAVALAALAAPAAALADPARITIVDVFDPITYGDNDYVNGQLVDAEDEGVAAEPVTLQQAPFPFGAWTDVATQTTDFAGYYSFKLQPSLVTRYRTVWNGALLSEEEVQVNVAPILRLRAKAVGKTAIDYSGRFLPAIEGQTIELQRLNRDRSWTTFDNPALDARGSFSGRLRTRRQVELRAVYTPLDGSLLAAESRTVRATPGAADSGRSARRAASCRAPRIVRVAVTPERPVAGAATKLRVRARIPRGRVHAIDVRWGDGDKRDHLTLAPAARKRAVTFRLAHLYAEPGRYVARIRVLGATRECRRGSARLRRTVTVAPADG